MCRREGTRTLRENISVAHSCDVCRGGELEIKREEDKIHQLYITQLTSNEGIFGFCSFSCFSRLDHLAEKFHTRAFAKRGKHQKH